jgi:PAS domain S-box-containing protein
MRRSNKDLIERSGKRINEKLTKKEETLASVFSASPDAIVVTDLSGKIIECNEAAIDLNGGESKEELIGKNALDLIIARDRQRATENMKKTIEKGSVKDIEYMLLTKERHEFPAELSASAITDTSGNPTSFVAIIKDISKRKQAEEALGESEKKCRSIVDNIGIGVVTISPSMEILALNNQMKKWFPEVDVSKKPICYETFNNPPRKKACSYCPTCKTLEDGQTHEAVTNTPRGKKAANYRVISSSVKDQYGRVEYAIEMVQDVTIQKQLEEKLEHYSQKLEHLVNERTKKLHESEQHFRSVADYASEAIVTIDAQDTIVFWNRAAETIFGYTPEEAIGKSISLVMPKRSKKFHQTGMKRIVSGAEADIVGKTHEFIGLRKDGSEFPLELSFSTWKTAKATYFTGIMRDITERKKTEQELLRFSTAVKSSLNGIITGDLDGSILDVNEAALRTYGSTDKRDLIGKNVQDLLVESDRTRALQNAIEITQTGQGKTVEYTALTKNGKVPIEVTTELLRDEKGEPTGFVDIIRDLTENKNQQRLLEESQQKFAALFSGNPEATVYVDTDMHILDINPRFTSLFGYSLDEIKGKDINDEVVPENLLEEGRLLDKKAAEGCIYHDTVRRVKDGSLVPVSVSAAPIHAQDKLAGYVWLYKDISKQKSVEESLKESEERFRDVAASTGEWIWEVDLRGHYTYSSPAVERVLGYRIEEVLGKTYFTFWSPDEQTRLKTHVTKAYRKKKPFLHFINRNIHKSGQVVILETNGVPILDPNGKIRGYRGSHRDVTEGKKIEERLSALNFYGGKLNAARSLAEIYEVTMDAMQKTLGFERASLMTVEKNNLAVSCSRGYSNRLPYKLPLDGSKRGITVKVATTQRPILVPDVKKDKDYVEVASDIRSELAVPIILEDNIHGVLNVESKEKDAFNEKDMVLLQILASHAATAISNLGKRKEIETRSNQLTSLMKSSAEMIHSTDLHRRLQAIMNVIKDLGWRRVVLSLRDENMEIVRQEDIVTAGLTDEEKKFLWTNRQPGQAWAERLGPEFKRFRMGEFYHLPWSDPWVRERFSEGTVPSRLSQEEMVDWDPQDLLYAPLRLADGRVVGVVSMDDPLDGKRPTKNSMAPLELFLHQAAVAIENARLIQQLNNVKTQIQEYAGQLEAKVEERTMELREAQDKLLKSERLAAIGELAGMVGHDLRNPLTGIAGAAYYLKTKYGVKLDNKAKEMLELIKKDIEYSNKIINDLLEYSKEIKLELTDSNPRTVMKETLTLVKIPKSVRLVNLTREKPQIKIDVDKMKRTFSNIIKNAIDAMPKGGTLTMKSRKLDNNLEFCFIDTGIGMPKSMIEKIFTPLFTTKAKGMGFGLSICKRNVEAHAGTIFVESAVGEGTTLRVTIPIRPKFEGGEKIWVKMPESSLLTTTKA